MRGFTQETQVAVIGGGILGLSTTYHLAKSGFNVALIEMDKIAACASGSNAGLIRKGDPVDNTESLIYSCSHDMYREWHEGEQLGIDIELREASVLRCFTEEHLERMEHGFWRSRKKIWEKEGLSPLKRIDWKIREPNVSEGITWGIETTSTMVNIFKVSLGLAWTAENFGASIHTDTRVEDIEVKSNKVCKVITNRGEVKTDFVVNAAGAWAPIIGRMVGLEIPILPAIGTALVTERTPRITNHMRLVYDPIWFNPEQPFMTSSDDACQRLGVTTEIDRHACENNYIIARSEHLATLPPSGGKTPTEPETLKHIAASAIRVVPKLENIKVVRAYAGLRPVCEVDGKPILGEVESVEGLILATGSWHTGMSYGPMCGKLVKEIISGDKTSIPIEELSYSRFFKEHHFPYIHNFRWT